MLSSGEITPSAIYQNNRLNKLMRQVVKELKTLGVNVNDSLQMTLLDVASETWEEANKGLSAATAYLNNQLAKEIINSSYKNAVYSERVWSNMALIRAQIEKCVIESAITGRDIKRVSRELTRRMDVGLYDAKRITLTETSRVLNESCRQNALRRGYNTYIIVAESGACDKCQALVGQHFPLSESVLPVHPFCKCSIRIDIE